MAGPERRACSSTFVAATSSPRAPSPDCLLFVTVVPDVLLDPLLPRTLRTRREHCYLPSSVPVVRPRTSRAATIVTVDLLLLPRAVYARTSLAVARTTPDLAHRPPWLTPAPLVPVHGRLGRGQPRSGDHLASAASCEA